MKNKKKVVAAALCVVMLLVGCGGKGSTDYSKYVTLGQYKGIEITAVPDPTKEEVETALTSRFREEVQLGDTVNIDYAGTLDGVAFNGGTANGQELAIGSHSFIDGFEDGLIGVKIGETVDLNLRFPDPYEKNPDLAGKEVVFTVTVNGINGIVGPELTDEVVAANTSYENIAAYRESVREELQTEADSKKLSSIWEIIQANTKISGYPKEEVEAYANEMKSYYETMATLYYGMDLKTFLSTISITEEEFNKECQTYGQQQTARDMTLAMIAKAEKITVSEEEFNEEVDHAANQSGQDRETWIKNYGGEESVRKSILYNKVLDFLLEQAVEI